VRPFRQVSGVLALNRRSLAGSCPSYPTPSRPSVVVAHATAGPRCSSIPSHGQRLNRTSASGGL